MTEEREPFPELTAAQIQEERLKRVPAIYSQPHEQLACDLALDIEDQELVFQRYGITPDQAEVMLQAPAFIALMAKVRKEMFETGTMFRTKTRAMAEGMLCHVFEIASDPLQPTAERVKIFQWLAKMGGLEPPPQKEAGAGAGGFTLNIAFAGEAPMKVVASQPQPLVLENQE